MHSVAKQQKKLKGATFGGKNFPKKKSRSAEKNERGDPLVSPGMVCYAGKQEKPFYFSLLAPVELPYISCKNLAEVVHFRHYLQESCKNLGFQTNLSDSCRSDISCRFRHFLQDSCRSRHFLQDSWTDLARQCLKLERYSARKCQVCTGNNKAFFPILNQENAQIECKCLVYVVART